MAHQGKENRAGADAAAKQGADEAAKAVDRTAREQGKGQQEGHYSETTKTGARVDTTVRRPKDHQEEDAYCPTVTDTTHQEFETKAQVIRKVPQMKEVEKTEMVKKLDHEEKTTSVPRTKVVYDEKTRTVTKPVVREVKKTRKVDVHRVVEEEKEVTEEVETVEEVRERKVDRVPRVVWEEKETWITKPVIKKVPKKHTIKVPRVITEKKEEDYIEYVTEEEEEQKTEKVPRIVTEHVKEKMTVPVIKEVPVTKKVEVPTGEYCEEVVSNTQAPAALGPAVLPEKVNEVVSDSNVREQRELEPRAREREEEARASPAPEPRRGFLGGLLG